MSKKILIPSDKKFGLFFCVVFFLIYFYFLFFKEQNFLYLLFIVFFLLIVSFIKPSILHKLNILWFKFGILLGKIISPIILTLIFFFIITPIAIIMKIINRDYLNIKNKEKNSYWKKYDNKINMKDQF